MQRIRSLNRPLIAMDPVWVKCGSGDAKRFRCTENSRLDMDSIARFWALDSWTITIGDDVLQRNAGGESRLDIASIRQIAAEAGLGDGQTKETALVITGKRQQAGAGEDGVGFWGSNELLCLAPSSCDHKKARDLQEGDEPAVHNYRPSEHYPSLPLQLVHPIFGRFLDIYHGVPGEIEPGKDDYKMFSDLSTECSRYILGENADYRTLVRDEWATYTGLDIRAPLFTGKTEEDGGYELDEKVNRTRFRALVLLNECRISICGNSSDPAFQVTQHYRLYWDKVGSKRAFGNSCYPTLALEHIGPFLRVSALANMELISAQPLTPFINLLNIQKHDVRAAEAGARLCLAVKTALRELVAFYREVIVSGGGAACREFLEQGVPYPLHGSVTCPVRWGNKLVYWVKEENVVVKYVQREYGEAVHRAWADAGYAPRIMAPLQTYPGGWTEIRMEYLSWEQGWRPLQALKKKADRLRPQVVEFLRRAHAVPVGDSFGVHGDARDINVMVRFSATRTLEEVKFIDFDWARQIGGRYPCFMNHDRVNWPPGVADNMPMLQEHDITLLSTLQADQLKDERLIED